MKAICPSNKDHKEFVTVAHVSQNWLVDEEGNFIEVRNECNKIVAGPNSGNTWICVECGSEAKVSD